MTAAEYKEYEQAVADFEHREGLFIFSTGRFRCAECLVEYNNDTGKCPECGADREIQEEAFFSWTPCECCGRELGGDRYYASGRHKVTSEILEYYICVDCVYYTAYGRLDDTTMDEIEREETK